MNISGLGNKLAVGNGQKATQKADWQKDLFYNRFSKQEAGKKRDVYEPSVEEQMYTILGNYEYYNIKTINRITPSGSIEMSAIVEAKVRNISYSESDHIQVNTTEGYTYRAKVDMSGHSVYVEYRDDEGSVKGYVADVPSIEKNTENPVEQMALAAWNKVLEENRRELGFTEYKEPILSGAVVPGTYVNGCFINDMPTYQNTIYLGKFGDACGMAGMFGGSWSDYYSTENGQSHPESIEVKLFTGRTIIIDTNRISDMGRLKGILSQAEYAQLEEAVTKEAGSIRMPQEKWDKLLKWTDGEIDKAKEQTEQRVEQLRREAQEKRLGGKKKAPYGHLADEGGVIVYNGVVFVCNEKQNAICLGDVSNPDNVLTIPLEGGGSLKVNRDNLSDLAKAISMFSAEDQERIMRAIQKDKKVQQMKQEIEDEKSTVGERITEQNNTQQPQEQDTSPDGKSTEGEEGDSQIIVKPDGSRVLVMTMKVGGMETQMSVELSKPSKSIENLEEKPSDRQR